MTFEEWQKQEQVLGLDMSALQLCRSAYEAGKTAKRRPLAKVRGCVVGRWMVFDGVSGSLLRGGFEHYEEAKEWARSNGFEVC